MSNENKDSEEKETTENPEKEEESSDQNKEENEKGKGKEKPKKKGSRKPLIILGIVLVLAAIAGTIYYSHARNYESTDDAFVDGDVVQVGPKVAGNVIAVHFGDNAHVTKGELLLELDPQPFIVAVEKAKAQLAQAEAQSVQQGAQTEVAGINFDRTNGLYTKDTRAVSKEQVDSTKATLDAAKGASDAAKASIQAAQASVHDAELQLSYTKVYAIADGRIARKQVEPGNYAQPGQTLCSLVLPEIWITANFKETQLTKMLRGQPVRIKVDAFPKRDLKGHVESFQPGTGARFSLLPAENATGNYVKVVQRVPVKIRFDESEQDLQRLAPGQSVTPTVDITVKPDQQQQPPHANQ
ncbi:MAG: HlyD family secretion protein [Chthoniobacterales bacterium]|nr:HlyD family secretion protein [Chthoniobacterales bacterium]